MLQHVASAASKESNDIHDKQAIIVRREKSFNQHLESRGKMPITNIIRLTGSAGQALQNENVGQSWQVTFEGGGPYM